MFEKLGVLFFGTVNVMNIMSVIIKILKLSHWQLHEFRAHQHDPTCIFFLYAYILKIQLFGVDVVWENAQNSKY